MKTVKVCWKLEKTSRKSQTVTTKELEKSITRVIIVPLQYTKITSNNHFSVVEARAQEKLLETQT